MRITASDTAQPPLSRRDGSVIAVLLGSAFVAILNETVMAVALPRVMAALVLTPRSGQWLTTAFMLTMAVVIPITGSLIQRLDTRRVFALAMSLFCLGTLVCGLSGNLPLLITGRVIQAAGAAILIPLLMTTIMTVVPPAARGAFMGRISIVISVAPAIGPTVSGLILSVLDWRWIFLLILPVGLAALVAGLRWIEAGPVIRSGPVDAASVLLAGTGFGALVYGLSRLGESAGSAGGLAPLGMLITGIVVIGGIVLRQLRLQARDAALLDLRTLGHPPFRRAAAMMAIVVTAMFGVFILLPLHLQSVLNLSPLLTGLMLLPGGLIMGLCAPTVGALFDRLGPRPLVVPGTALCCGAILAMASLPTGVAAWTFVVAHVTLSLGLALVFTPLFTFGLGALPPALYPHGSAFIGTTQQVAGAAGTAIFVALMTSRASRLALSGSAASEAAAGGLRAAFLFGSALCVAAFILGLGLPGRTASPDADAV